MMTNEELWLLMLMGTVRTGMIKSSGGDVTATVAAAGVTVAMKEEDMVLMG